MSNWDRIKHKTYDPKEKGFGNSDKWKGSCHDRITGGATKTEKKPKYTSMADCKTLRDLQRQYRKLLMQYHPDKMGDTEESKQKTREIIETFEKLKRKFD